MPARDTERHGQRVVDYFSAQPHRPYDEAETMGDVRSGVHVVRTLIRMGRFQQAADEYRSGLGGALYSNLDAHNEVLSLLRPFFPGGWAALPSEVGLSDAAYLANCVGNALGGIDNAIQAVEAFESA